MLGRSSPPQTKTWPNLRFERAWISSYNSNLNISLFATSIVPNNAYHRPPPNEDRPIKKARHGSTIRLNVEDEAVGINQPKASLIETSRVRIEHWNTINIILRKSDLNCAIVVVIAQDKTPRILLEGPQLDTAIKNMTRNGRPPSY